MKRLFIVLSLLVGIPAVSQTIRPTFLSHIQWTNLTTAQEAGMTLAEGSMWWNTDLNCVRLRLTASSVCLEESALAVLLNPSASSQTIDKDLLFKGPRPWLDVRAYGAKGDGVTDDTSIINTVLAIADALVSGSTNTPVVFFPMGQYCITDTLDSSQAHFVGVAPRNHSAILWCTTTNKFALTGTVTFTNASKAVTGSGGTLFTTELEQGDIIKRDSDDDTTWAMVDVITNDTTITLAEDYTGTTGGGASSRGAIMIRKNSSLSFWKLENLALLRNSITEQPITMLSLGTGADLHMSIENVHMSGAIQHCIRLRGWVNFHIRRMRWDACGGFAIDSLQTSGMGTRSWSLDDFTYAFADANVTGVGGFRFKKVASGTMGTVRISTARVEIDSPNDWDASGVQALVQIEWDTGETGARWGQIHLEDISYQDIGDSMANDVLLGLVNEPGGSSPFPFTLVNLKTDSLSDTLGPDAASWNGISLPVPTEGRYGFYGGDVQNNHFESQVTFGGGGIDVDGSGFKHQRGTAGCATAATIGATCTTTVTWTTAIADTSYTVSCWGVGTTSGVPINGAQATKAAASIQHTTVALTAVAAQFTTVECKAVHD